MVNSVMMHFKSLPDPRSPLGRRHVLSDLLTIAICATICGADGWVQVAEFGQAKRKWFATFLELPHGIPSHDTFGRLFARLDPDALERCFRSWVDTLAKRRGMKAIQLDGKSLRRSFQKAWDKSGMVHLVSAFVSANRLVLGQMALDKGGESEEARRENEITVLPKLLTLLDLEGTTVSIDAIGCQRSIAQQIVDQKGDYVLVVKDNQPTLHEKLKQLLDEAILESFKDLHHDYFEETEGDHGRIETRRLWVTDQVQHIQLAEPWPGLGSVLCVERYRQVLGGQTTMERHYYVSSRKDCDAAAMAEAVRSHWGVENGLHWQLDVSFAEDQCRVREGHAAENLSRLRRIALNLLQQEKTRKVGIATKRLRAGWDHDYLLKVLAGG